MHCNEKRNELTNGVCIEKEKERRENEYEMASKSIIEIQSSRAVEDGGKMESYERENENGKKDSMDVSIPLKIGNAPDMRI